MRYLLTFFALMGLASAQQLVQVSDDTDFNPIVMAFASTESAGQYRIITLGEPTTAGNLLTAFVEIDSTATPPTLTLQADNTSTVNGWTAAPIQTFTLLNSAGSCTANSRDVYIYYLPNVTAGFRAVKVAFNSTNSNGGGSTVAEWSGVATASPKDGTGFVCSASQGSSGSPPAAFTFSAGSFTPSVTGDLVIEHAWDSYKNLSGGSGIGVNYTAGTGQSNITWTKFQDSAYWATGAQWGVYNASTALNPSFIENPPSGTSTPGAVRIAAFFKAQGGAGGSPTGIHILAKKLNNTDSSGTFSVSPLHVYFPCTGGNLLVANYPAASSSLTVADTLSNTWAANHAQTCSVTGGGTACVNTWSSHGATTSQSERIDLTFSNLSAGSDSTWLYCIAGAVNSAPSVVVAHDQEAPLLSITPAAAPGLVLVTASQNTSSTTAFGGPAGALFEGCFNSNQNTDGGGCGANNTWGAFHNSTTAAESWTVVTSNGAGLSGDAAEADAYQAAPSSTSWSGILAPARAIDWSNAGLPATIPVPSSGSNLGMACKTNTCETPPNPWTPPTRTQCTTAQCSTVSGGSVTATTVNAAIVSAPAGTYVLIPAGTFALGGDILFSTSANNVTVRGSGAANTKLTGGGFTFGTGLGWAGATLLTANPVKGATSITVAAAPTAGRIADIEQCADGFSAANANYTNFGSGTVCTGSFTDPVGLWVCGLTSSGVCSISAGGSSNAHFQEHVLWIPAGGITGSTVNFTTPLEHPNWSTSRTAALTWLSSNGMVGLGIEDLTLDVGAGAHKIGFLGTYASWVKGCRVITTAATGEGVLTFHFDSHSLAINNYIGSTVGGASSEFVQWGSDSGEQGMSDHLFINNILDGGFAFGLGNSVGHVYAYNYYHTSNNNSFMSNGSAQHHEGTMFLLNEGNQTGMIKDDSTWGTHNINSFFRNYVSCTDPTISNQTGPGLAINSWARFENAIGNALGNTIGGGTCADNTYRGAYDLNGPGGSNPVDTTGLTQASLMRWGNYALCTGDTHCNTVSFDSAEVPTNLASFGANSTPYQNTVPATHNLPASFFMNNMGVHSNGGTGLGWWKTCLSWTTFPTSCASFSTPPMPPIGPEVTGGQNMSGHAYNIPAELAFASLPNDANYPTAWGNLKQFDESVFQNDPSSGSTCSTPTFAPVAGTYNSNQSVTLTDSCSRICWTSDGTTPAASTAGTCSNGNIYSGSISVGVTETLQAIGTQSGNTNSSVGSALYTIINTPPAPALNMLTLSLKEKYENSDILTALFGN